jgi:hypothetical protein
MQKLEATRSRVLLSEATAMIATFEECRVESGAAVWLNRIQAEYRAMPGLSLTQSQMQRLWGLEAHTCETLIDALLAARVLRRTANDCFIAYNA